MRFPSLSLLALQLLALSVLATLSCAQAKVVVPPMDAGQVLVDKLETRLMRAQTVHIEADLYAAQSNARLHESLFLGAGQRARVEVAGVIDDQRVSSTLVCDGSSLAVVGQPARKAPAEVRDALLIDFVRRGLLPNALAIARGNVPDHVDGGVRDAFHLEREHAGDPATEITFHVVAGREQNAIDRGEARLSLDREEKPRTRQFADDVERYAIVELDVPIDDTVFALPH